MQTIDYADSKLSKKYQTVVPKKVRKALGVEKNDRLSWKLTKKGKEVVAEVKPKPRNWAKYMQGLGKGIWEDDEDIEKYINKLRDEWDK